MNDQFTLVRDNLIWVVQMTAIMRYKSGNSPSYLLLNVSLSNHS